MLTKSIAFLLSSFRIKRISRTHIGQSLSYQTVTSGLVWVVGFVMRSV
jgi:hypothetical protein